MRSAPREPLLEFTILENLQTDKFSILASQEVNHSNLLLEKVKSFVDGTRVSANSREAKKPFSHAHLVTLMVLVVFQALFHKTLL